jgi:hypothetical protein
MTYGQMPSHVLKGVIDDAHLTDLRIRNEARAKDLIQQMGPKWACWNPNPPRKQS